MREIIKNNIHLIILWLLCFCGFVFFCGHFSEILIDFGREVYYPEQLLNGKVLYKDLFNIYGPLSYQINAVLYKIFGCRLSTLYGAGFLCSLFVVSGMYLIAQKFLSKFLSFAAVVFSIAVGVATTSIFNFYFPYSWSVLYGLCAFLYSLYFLLNFNGSKKSFDLCISSFLAGICITCKYDFLLYALIILFFIIKEKNLKAFLCFLTAPLLSFGVLFIQGMGLNDILNQLYITAAMGKSKTLTYFYQNSGIYFHPKALSTDLIIFLKTVLPFSGILTGWYLFDKNKPVSLTFSIIGWGAFLYLFPPGYKTAFCFLTVLLFLLTVFSIKRVKASVLILAVSTLCACAKVFWLMLINSYGNYYITAAIIAILALIFSFLPEKLEKITGIYLIVIASIIMFMNIQNLKFNNYEIKTEKGKIYTNENLAKSTNELIKYLNTTEGNAVIFPEGMTVNFLADVLSDDFYNSLLPLYTETFTEEKIIEHYKNKMPEYIIFNNLNMKDYYFQYICNDYALNFCGFVQENYKPEAVIDNGFRYIIFKRK